MSSPLPRQPSRRQPRGLVWLGLLVAPALATAAGLPEVNLGVQWRVVPLPADSAASRSTGTVTVGTGTATNPTPPGTVTTRTAPPAEPESPQLRVKNGEEALLRLSSLQALVTQDWLWTAQGQGLQTQTRWRPLRQSLWVKPQWPGGSAPVRLAYRLDASRIDEAASAPTQRQLEAQLLVPLNTWVELGRWGGPGGSGERLELRVSR